MLVVHWQMINTWGFVVHTVSFTATQLQVVAQKQAQTSVTVSVTLKLQKQAGWQLRFGWWAILCQTLI